MKLMMISFITVVMSVALLSEPILAKPFVNPGEYILRSCTATAHLHKIYYRDRGIVKIVPSPAVSDARQNQPNKSLRERILPANKRNDSDPITIIKIETVPNVSRVKIETLPKKGLSTVRKHNSVSDTPLTTIKVNAIRADTPLPFQPQDELPEVDKTVKKGSESIAKSSPITVIKVT